MEISHRKTLEYLQNRPWIALGAILDECPDASEAILKKLNERGLIEYERLVGDGNVEFFRPTKEGARILWPRKKRMIVFWIENRLLIIGTIAAVIAAIAGVITLVYEWNKTSPSQLDSLDRAIRASKEELLPPADNLKG